MKKLFILLLAVFILSACHRSACPAYMNGESTGMEGNTKGKKTELFPKKMKKRN